MKKFNIKYPLVDDTETNSFFQMNVLTKEGLKSNLLLLLLTRKGERYYNPEFGTNLLKFIFEPNNSMTAKDIESEIKRVVNKYIPVLTIDSVSFNDTDDEKDDTRLNVHINFTYSEDMFSEAGELDLNF